MTQKPLPWKPHFLFISFSRTFLGKNAQFQNMCAKKRNDFRQRKRSNFRVEKCKTEENLSKFLNNMAYKTVTSMRDLLWNFFLCKTWIVFILIKCICFIITINQVWSRVKNHCFKKKHCFKKTHCFPTCALFYPIVLKGKTITDHKASPALMDTPQLL